MSNILLKAMCYFAFAINTWQPDFATAKKTATERHQLILLNFSGSDWCGPCIKMHKEIFADKEFTTMADTTLVMYNADFPRNKKNQLPEAIKKQNEQLAERYNPDGNFPFTVLINEKGELVKSWLGIPAETPGQFTATIKLFCDGHSSK